MGLVNPPPETIDQREVRRLSSRGLHDRPLACRPAIDGRGDPGRPADPHPFDRPAHGDRRLARQGRTRDGRRRAVGSWCEPCWPRARASSASIRSSSASRSIRASPSRTGPTRSTSRPTTPAWPPTRCRTWPPCSPGLASQPDVREVSLVGQGLAGPQVLLARPLLEGLARTVVDLVRLARLRRLGPIPPALDLPGLYQFGGFKAAAALAAPAPLWIYRPGRRSSEPGPRLPMSLPDPRTRCGSRPTSSRPRPSRAGSTGASEAGTLSALILQRLPAAPAPCNGRTSRRRESGTSRAARRSTRRSGAQRSPAGTR